MKKLKEVYLHDEFEVNLPQNPHLMEKLVGVGLIPGRIFTVLFQLANGAIIIGNGSIKIAIDSITASNIIVTIV